MNKAIIKRLLTAKGRLNRTEFIAYSFMYNIALYSFAFLFQYTPNIILYIAETIILILYLYFFLSLLIMRVHDYNEKAWYILLAIIPILNIYVMFQSGDPCPNQYGIQPNKPSIQLKLIALAWPLSIIIMFIVMVQYI